MSTQSQSKSQQTEIKRSPFDQTFLCPKCSELLFTKIFYQENTNTPMVHFICPKRHSGVVDLILFFDLFYSSNQEIENELSKFEEELDRDIEIHRKKKQEEARLIEEEINKQKQKIKEEEKIKDDKKDKEEEKKEEINGKENPKEEKNNKEEENNKEEKNDKEEDKKEEETVKEKEDMREEKNGEEDIKEDDKKENNVETNKEINLEMNSKLFKELEKCNIIGFSLSNDKTIEIVNKENEKINNPINVDSENKVKSENNNKLAKKKSKEKKAITHKINNNMNLIKKSHSLEKEEKFKEEKFLCDKHNKSHFVAYCLSCKKNICKKCLKSKKHKSKMFKHIKITEKNLNELNKLVGQCQESLNKFEKQNKILIDSLSSTEEQSEKVILFILSKTFIEINKEYLNEVKVIIKNYNNCQKNKMLNYEIITSIKNVKIRNNMVIPNDIQELISILKDFKDYLFEKNFSLDNYTKNNKILLFEIFNDIIKNDSEGDNEKGIIKFTNIIENEKFKNLINISDFKEEVCGKNGEGEDEKEIHQAEKIDYDLNDFEDGEDMEEESQEGENDNEEDYEDYNDDNNNDEDENNYGDDEDEIKDEEDKEN